MFGLCRLHKYSVNNILAYDLVHSHRVAQASFHCQPHPSPLDPGYIPSFPETFRQSSFNEISAKTKPMVLPNEGFQLAPVAVPTVPPG